MEGDSSKDSGDPIIRERAYTSGYEKQLKHMLCKDGIGLSIFLWVFQSLPQVWSPFAWYVSQSSSEEQDQ